LSLMATNTPPYLNFASPLAKIDLRFLGTNKIGYKITRYA